MRHILFIVPGFNFGGINRALESIINSFDSNHYVFDIFSLRPEGGFEQRFQKVNIKRPNLVLKLINRCLRDQKGLSKVATASVKMINRVCRNKLNQALTARAIKKLSQSTDYDVAIAFSEGQPIFLLDKLKTKKKAAWIHCDYASYSSIVGDVSNERTIYSTFDKIICVSNFTRESFIGFFPELRDKCVTIRNILDIDKIKELSIEPIEEKETFSIVTIGRIDHIKNQSIIPKIARGLKSQGLGFRWDVIGPITEISEYDLLISEIKKYGVSECVKLLGAKDNPYPYYKNADLVVNTSVSEACPYVVSEAMVLGKPVVCRNFGSSAEFIENGVNGCITTLEEMGDVIARLMTDRDFYNQLRDNISSFEYGNYSIKEAIEKVFLL